MELISLENLKKSGLKIPHHPMLQNALAGYLKVPQMNKLYNEKLLNADGITFIDKLFASMRIGLEVDAHELKNLPSNGPFIVISNHPYGFLDGLAMIKLIGERHPSFKVMANYFLGEFGPINPYLIPVNPFGKNHQLSISGIKAAMEHVSIGHPLGLFPAGEVASAQNGLGKAEEKQWDLSIVKFMLKCNVPIVPMFFHGQNSLPFHLLGKMHPGLRTLSIPGEFFNKQGQKVKVRIGQSIMPSDLAHLSTIEKKRHFMMVNLLALEQPAVKKGLKPIYFRKTRRIEPIIAPINQTLIENDLEVLRQSDACIFTKSNYDVYLGHAHQMPNILKEIGRLRELTFRLVGEGTNKSIDLDGYDNYYQHLFVYDNSTRSIIGAYRLGLGDEIVQSGKRKGFYVQSLFDLGEPLKPLLQQTLELGRSFVVQSHQQKPLPLFLLWQGILHVLRSNNQYRYLMGPVSISNDLSAFSRDLIKAFVKKHHYDHHLAQWVKPKYLAKMQSNPLDVDIVLEQNRNDLQQLDRFIARIEPRALKVPVLLKQYIRQNAKIIGFNVDPYFNNSLDGLMLLDINNLPNETLMFLDGR